MDSDKYMDPWRELFTDVDIFEIINNAICVAATDYPEDLKFRRGDIVEQLYSCHTAHCLECAEMVEKHDSEIQDMLRRCVNGLMYDDDRMLCWREKMSPVKGSGFVVNGTSLDKPAVLVGKDCAIPVDEPASEPMVAVDDEVRENNGGIVDEVLLLKSVLIDHANKSEDVLVESLTRLGSMKVSLEVLKITGIGKTLRLLKKHESEKIRRLSQNLYEDWMQLVEDSTTPSKEIKLKQPTIPSIAKSVPERSCSELNGQTGKKDDLVGKSVEKKVKKPTIPTNSNSNHPLRSSMPDKQSIPNRQVAKPGLQESELHRMQTKKKRLEKLSNLDGNALRKKLESSKRKLQEGYQQVDEVKRQRNIKVLELDALPESTRTGKYSAPKPAKLKHKRWR